MSAVYIAGIAASQAWDTAGESIDIAGMDISSLVGSVFNFEHKSEKSSDYIGKILKAKKIFSSDDCSNELELKYWSKCQIPFLFCLGVLFNEYQPAAKEVAGIFEFDANNPGLPPTLGFSIEGAKQEKVNGVITHSIARKLTITGAPANKTCLADKVSLEPTKKDPLDFLSKSVEIELFDEQTMQKSMNMKYNPKTPKAGLKQAPGELGVSIGTTTSGKHIMSHEKIHNYTGFTPEDHRNASVLHNTAAIKANTQKNGLLSDHHNQKKKLHDQAAAGLERKANRVPKAIKAHTEKLNFTQGTEPAAPPIKKALTASGVNVSPGQLTGGAALQSQSPAKKKTQEIGTVVKSEEMNNGSITHIKQKEFEQKHPYSNEKVHSDGHTHEEAKSKVNEMRSQGIHASKWHQNGPKTGPKSKYFVSVPHDGKVANFTKSDQWLARAEHEYKNWDKREVFEKFMKSRVPDMAKAQIEALGKTFLLKKSVEAEKALKKLIKK